MATSTFLNTLNLYSYFLLQFLLSEQNESITQPHKHTILKNDIFIIRVMPIEHLIPPAIRRRISVLRFTFFSGIKRYRIRPGLKLGDTKYKNNTNF